MQGDGPGQKTIVPGRRHVGILACIEPSLRIGEDVSDEAYDPLGDLLEKGIAEKGIAVHIVSQEPCIVIGHLLEMGDDPCLIGGIPVESSADLVVEPALRHRLERLSHRVTRMLVSRIEVPVDEELRCAGHREFRRRAESPVLWVEMGDDLLLRL